MPTHKKIHSCKPHKATLKSKLAREYFFLSPKKNFFPPFLFLRNLFSHRTDFVRNRTDIALNVNRLEQSVRKLDTTHLRTDSRAAHNIRLNEIKKRRALFGNQSVVLLSNIFGKRTGVHLIPSFFYFVNPFFVSGNG